VADGYIELHHVLGATPNVRILEAAKELIWFSERDGWGHLYLYDIESGALKNRITQGEWMVRDIVHVDELRRRLLFTACGVDAAADPARRTLCAVNLDGSGFEVLIAHDADVVVPKTEPWGPEQDRPSRPRCARPGVSPNGRFGVVRLASVIKGNRTQVVDLQAQERGPRAAGNPQLSAIRAGIQIASAEPEAGEIEPRQFTALAADGVTRLHGVMFLPSHFDPKRRYPLIDYIYPGPQIPHQPQSFGAVNAAHARALAELGFITVMFDTRGMPFRSRALHQVGYGHLLEPQLSDHAAVVLELCARHAFLDRDRIGMFGQSGGGYATQRALFDYGTIFKVGVAICAPDDPALYNSTTSNKYRGPANPRTWPEQANRAVAHQLQGKLLLITGDMDENVHMSHTLAVTDALIRANRDFDLLVVPNEGHLLFMRNGYVVRRVWDYFVRHLSNEAPPEGFMIRFEAHERERCERNLIREFGH
jgi:dipeptidyl aminopeptidase/acylaminoacyl peptidase